MKPLFTLLCFAFLINLNAQSLSLNMNQIEKGMSETIEYGEITVTNNGTTAIEIAVHMAKVCDLTDATQVTVCVGELCYIPVTEATWGETGDPILVIEPGASYSEFKFTPTGVTTIGSEWYVEFYDRNNNTDIQRLDISLGSCTVGVTNIVYEVGEAFPNPTTETVNITLPQSIANAQMVVMNALGIQVYATNIDTRTQVAIDVADYQNGVYFYFVRDEDNNVSTTRSFVKK